MTYSRLKLEDILERFGVQMSYNSNLFLETKPRPVSALLQNTLNFNLDLAVNIGTEKARSELLIMPVFAELYQQASDHISLFSGVALNVDKERGLAGEVDFLLSRSSVRSIFPK